MVRNARQSACLRVWTGSAVYHGIEIIPRTGLNLLRYKRRLRWMAEEVCPPDKSWQVILLLIGAVGLFGYAFVRWWTGC